LNVTPLGKAPDSVSAGAGVPVTVTVNIPGVPAMNVEVFGLVIEGGFGQLFTKLLALTDPIPVAKSQPVLAP
jgi:hypothetical protein